ncbi:PH domain-containing protein [Dactylosporangium sp. AC04546]|uniref:PH domain-containing protein n=1 Tax=Dactylosporangium sp. AC04546 TaxID=2862460 RepID=UPI001EE0C857|nr:PH domain-containing protein [Dactylosporangium sp. AC04546]WVK85664.1 PH domain-containing protein [Dactylosporangium sp. AC04546]
MTVAPDPLRPWPDTVAWRPISPRYFLVRVGVLAVWVFVLTVASLVAGLLVSGWFVLLALAIVVLGVVRALFLRRSLRAWGYAERAEDLLVRHGLLVRRLSIVPYARMQFVDVTAGPLERAAGLATVTLHTAAAASDATVPGLDAAEATRLRDRLAALGEIREEGL